MHFDQTPPLQHTDSEYCRGRYQTEWAVSNTIAELKDGNHSRLSLVFVNLCSIAVTVCLICVYLLLFLSHVAILQ